MERYRAGCRGLRGRRGSSGSSGSTQLQVRGRARRPALSRGAIAGVTSPAGRRLRGLRSRGPRRERMRDAHGAAVPDLPQHHRRRRARRRSTSSASPCRSSGGRCRPGPRRTTGRSTTSGTCADAYIADATGRRVVDFRAHNLHLVSYSVPVRATMTLDELRPHLHTLPDHPDWIPYRTTYYHRTWGFCLTQRPARRDGRGSLRGRRRHDPRAGRADLRRAGASRARSTDEVLVSAHVCHPSLANDNLSGIAVATRARRGRWRPCPRRRFTYRFLFAPGTIGSITWLSRNPEILARIRHGLVLTGLGGPGPLVYKRTRHGDAAVDRAAAHVVDRPWWRGARLLAVRLRRAAVQRARASTCRSGGSRGRRTASTPSTTPRPTTWPSSGDDELAESYDAVARRSSTSSRTTRAYQNLSPYGEPQLGKRGLYPTMGGKTASDAVMAMLWIARPTPTGEPSLLDIAAIAGLDFADIRAAAATLPRRQGCWRGCDRLAPAQHGRVARCRSRPSLSSLRRGTGDADRPSSVASAAPRQGVHTMVVDPGRMPRTTRAQRLTILAVGFAVTLSPHSPRAGAMTSPSGTAASSANRSSNPVLAVGAGGYSARQGASGLRRVRIDDHVAASWAAQVRRTASTAHVREPSHWVRPGQRWSFSSDVRAGAGSRARIRVLGAPAQGGCCR